MHNKARSVILCLLALALLICGFILSTTSSLYESFIISLRHPIANALKGFYIVILLFSLLNIFTPGARPLSTLFLKQLGWIIVMCATGLEAISK